jgi:proteic killer suppression protein
MYNGLGGLSRPLLKKSLVMGGIRYVTRYGQDDSLDDPRGVISEHLAKLGDILAKLDAARVVGDMDMPGFRLHALKGASKGLWVVTVRGNWRVTFRFADPDAFEVDYVDYH